MGDDGQGDHLGDHFIEQSPSDIPAGTRPLVR